MGSAREYEQLCSRLWARRSASLILSVHGRPANAAEAGALMVAEPAAANEALGADAPTARTATRAAVACGICLDSTARRPLALVRPSVLDLRVWYDMVDRSFLKNVAT